MKIHSKAVWTTILCSIFALPLIVVAQVPVNAQQKKAASAAALTKPAVVETSVRPSAVVSGHPGGARYP